MVRASVAPRQLVALFFLFLPALMAGAEDGSPVARLHLGYDIAGLVLRSEGLVVAGPFGVRPELLSTLPADSAVGSLLKKYSRRQPLDTILAWSGSAVGAAGQMGAALVFVAAFADWPTPSGLGGWGLASLGGMAAGWAMAAAGYLGGEFASVLLPEVAEATDREAFADAVAGRPDSADLVHALDAAIIHVRYDPLLGLAAGTGQQRDSLVLGVPRDLREKLQADPHSRGLPSRSCAMQVVSDVLLACGVLVEPLAATAGVRLFPDVTPANHQINEALSIASWAATVAAFAGRSVTLARSRDDLLQAIEAWNQDREGEVLSWSPGP